MAAPAARSDGERGAVVLCPVTVHRWFSGGEGWTWCSDGTPEDFVERLAEVLRTRPAKAQVGLVEDGPPWWFYHQAPDPDPVDPKAQGRQPSILRAVALPGQPRSDYTAICSPSAWPSFRCRTSRVKPPAFPGGPATVAESSREGERSVWPGGRKSLAWAICCPALSMEGVARGSYRSKMCVRDSSSRWASSFRRMPRPRVSLNASPVLSQIR